MFLFSREDVENFPPLNTPTGIAFLNKLIDQLGGVDGTGFDNIMALIAGDQKDEDSWTKVLPLVNSLTKRSIGQVWVNHTGHDTSRGYGTKTREWRMDTVIHLTAVEHPDTDASFELEFRKAREHTPENRKDFANVTMALISDAWEGSATVKRVGVKEGSKDAKALEFLKDTLASHATTIVGGRRMVPLTTWQMVCARGGFVRNFILYKERLIAANLIVCDGDFVGLR